MQEYVTGFMFSADAEKLVVIKKLKPLWQCGLYNGVGGKIEANELSIDAMVREFKEETGVITQPENWTCFANVYRPNVYDVDMYFSRSDLAFQVQSIEQEEVHIINVNRLPENLIPNLRWLIPLALDSQADFSAPVRITEVAENRVTA